MKTGRRDFLRRLVGASGAALLGSMVGPGRALGAVRAQAATSVPVASVLPPPDESGIEHVVVLMMENRSFDHFLGWLPNADGQQAGLSYVDPNGVSHDTAPLAPDYTGSSHPDPSHSYSGGRTQYNGGAMDGFLRSSPNDDFAIGYYVEEDRPFANALARNYTTLDRYFCSILGPTFPNRFFLHAAQTDRLSNTFTIARMPTIWDRLSDAGISGGYYFSNLRFLDLWGGKYSSVSHPYREFLDAAATGTLPAVSFVDPRYTLDGGIPGNDDHPPADIRNGDALIAEVFNAVACGPDWPNTVLVIAYDEWGGFFEHVPPPRVIAPNTTDPDLDEDGKALLGFRVPTVVASPFSGGDPNDPTVNSLLFDHTSILKLIEWRWSLPPLTARDASDEIHNLALALNFDNPRADLPELPRPLVP